MQAKEVVRFQLPSIDCPIEETTVPWLSHWENSFASLPTTAIDLPTPSSEFAKQSSVRSDWVQQGAFAASATLTLTAGAAVLFQPPVHEGQFALRVDSSPIQAGRANRTATVMPQISPETVSKVLASPRVIDPVLDRLRAKNRSLDYETLTRNLTVQVQSNQLKVSYRDQDPERLEAVLQTLAQAYVQYGQECRTSQCRGLNYIERQLPKIQQQVDRLRTEIQQFEQQHGLSNFDLQVRQFSVRSFEVTKQQTIVEQNLWEAQNRHTQLERQLGLKHPVTARLLLENSRYQSLLSQLRQVDRQIATELSRLNSSAAQMRTLSQRYQLLQTQLEQVPQQVLAASLKDPRANLQDPILKTPEGFILLKQAIATLHNIQLLQVRQDSIEFAQQQIADRHQEVPALLRQHNQLQQQYNSQLAILQEYLNQQKMLKAVPSVQQNWTLMSPPEILHRPLEVMTRSITWEEAATAALGGIALGLGIAAGKGKPQNAGSH